MSTYGKDSPEVIEFMTMFTRLKDWCDDEPQELQDLAASDSSVAELSVNLSWAAAKLEKSERTARALFATPVDPVFLNAWRDYEKRYAANVFKVWLKSQKWSSDLDSEHSSKLTLKQRWESNDVIGRELSEGIEAALEFSEFFYDNLGGDDDEEFWNILGSRDPEKIGLGHHAWERLKSETSFDLRGVFRRRELIPFVLIPRRVAARHGDSDILSILKNLQQAHDAFVFGAPFASIALMRSIMEAVLRDHYEAAGNDLNERIRSARNKLPADVNEAALHRLRKLANSLLHLDKENSENLLKLDDAQMEREIVWLLFVLRALIEGARQRL